MSATDLPVADHARNLRLIGHSDQGGRPDGVQLMVHRGYAYVGHMFSQGFSVIDVRNPRAPRPVHYEKAPPMTWNIHLQTHDDLLLVINAKDMFADAAFADERNYYTGALGKTVGTAAAGDAQGQTTERSWTAGLSVFDISHPEAPRRIGFMPVEGVASIASGTPVAAGPMSQPCSTGSRTTSFSSWTWPTRRDRARRGASGCRG